MEYVPEITRIVLNDRYIFVKMNNTISLFFYQEINATADTTSFAGHSAKYSCVVMRLRQHRL